MIRMGINAYQCKCGHETMLSSFPPYPCYACQYCGTTLAKDAEGRHAPSPHVWFQHTPVNPSESPGGVYCMTCLIKDGE